MKHYISIFLLLTVSLLGYAQKGSIKSGDRHFGNFAFQQAINKYKAALNTDPTNIEAKLKLAESYRKINDQENAEKWFSKVIEENGTMTSNQKLHYAEALASNGNYDQAKQWFTSYNKEVGSEERIVKKLSAINNKETLLRNSSGTQIELVPFNSKQADFSPAFHGENIVFVSGRSVKKGKVYSWDNSSFLDLYEVNADGKISNFKGEVNTRYHEGPLVLFENDTKVIFTRNNFHKNKSATSSDGVNKLKLFSANKTDKGWGKATPLPFNNDEYSVGHPTITQDGSTLYFASDMPGGMGGVDLYKSTWARGNWQTPENLGDKINTEGDELFPFLMDDKELYFASNGHGGLGGLDLFGLELEKGSEAKIVNVGAPINSSLDDFGLIVRNGGKEGYFSSNRKEGTGGDDIYSFVADRPILGGMLVKGTVTDEETGEVLPGAVVTLMHNETKVATTSADDNGRFVFNVDPEKAYKLGGTFNEYFDGKNEFSTINAKDKTAFISDLVLMKDHGFSLYGIISESESNNPLADVNIEVIDNMTGTTILKKVTPSTGDFRGPIADKKLNDRISYQVKLSKEGYLGKVVTYNAQLLEPGEVKLHEKLDITLNKIDVGTDIGKLIEINPIYFDLNKHKIRPDAATELDKIVKVMQENPTLEIELGSHTDSRGSDAYNLSLSDKRAKSSAAYIVTKGISETRIKGKGYGEVQLVNRCGNGVKCSKEEHQQNRRTEFLITKF